MIVKVLATRFVTHDVKSYIVEKPNGFKFTPGNATEVAINKPEWKDKKRPFTFTSLNEDLVLEFTIKSYPVNGHKGVTDKLSNLEPGDELILNDPWGTISFKGPGIFIAGGAGITPFLAIFRQLKKDNKIKGNRLFFSNKEEIDIIHERELKSMFSDKSLVLTLTQNKNSNYSFGRIDEKFLEKNVRNFDQNFYVCGPKDMVNVIRELLAKLGARSENIIFEK